MQQKNIVTIICLAIVVALTGCSPEQKYHVLTFFFDGVPEMNFNAVSDSLLADTTSTGLVAGITKPSEFFHQPFNDKECESCHIKGTIGELNNPQPKLCYQCHENFSSIYSSLHGPVMGGYCTECHSPHKSKLEFLLLNSGQELCLKCHDAEILNQSLIHNDMESTNCIVCHNPHGAENRSYTRDGICYKCHEDFNSKYNVLHGPVASNYCSMCHGSHALESQYKLVRKGQEICYYCHLSELVLANNAHTSINNINCTECHNPHGANNKFLLN